MLFTPNQTAVIILSYNGNQDTLACLNALDALAEQPRLRVVVDNGSEKDAVGEMLSKWQRVAAPIVLLGENAVLPPDASCILLALPVNIGYSAGNNSGIRLALQDSGCTAFWILNNDTEPQEQALSALCARLTQCPEAGMAGSTLVYTHLPELVQCAGGWRLNPLLGTTQALYGGAGLSDVSQMPPERVEERLSYIAGASMLVRRDTIEHIGLLAEEFFLYYEDAEFGLRAGRAGFGQVWAPGSIVKHKEGGSSGAVSQTASRVRVKSALVDYLSLRNRIYLIRKYFPKNLWSAIPGYAGVLAARIARGQVNRIPLVLRALWDGLCGRMGKPDETRYR